MVKTMTTRLKLRDSVKLIINFKTTATITPSFNRLAERLLGSIDFSVTLVIAELGP